MTTQCSKYRTVQHNKAKCNNNKIKYAVRCPTVDAAGSARFLAQNPVTGNCLSYALTARTFLDLGVHPFRVFD